MDFLNAIWFSIVRFVRNLFTKSTPTSPLPIPVTSKLTSVKEPTTPLKPASCSPDSTPSTVIVRRDRSTPSPTTMSDGSLEVISTTGRLPSPWSPVGRITHLNEWMSVDGTLVNAVSPPVNTTPKSITSPLSKRDNIVDIPTVSSLAYELRMGLFAESMTAFENILPLLDQTSPTSSIIPPL